ncbi:alpha-2-macroglobulin family protein [Fibrella sp. HMF5335]|uniref:Alpha-2-macroglobulin family protein n=1 Tax=Fibrella rubiginis TaxID=2817060 RepID=A0A939GIT0_9BACT|nr:alpha-2-macroglobulin [Fibrella rubiginis]MBO0938225.1 alpha-2-macroglobulin family protein [Fibrella rubiginis]
MLLPASARLLSLVLLCLLLTQCAHLSNTVQVTGRNFGEEIQQAQNLTFSFNKNVGPTTSNWESTPYITFKPAIAGKFRWTSPSELVFSPETTFDPATNYRAELTNNIIKAAPDKGLSVSGEEIAFHTPYLQLASTETWWTRDRDGGKPVAKSRLVFNYDLPAAEVSTRLQIQSDKQKLITGSIQAGQAGSALMSGTNGGLVVTLPDAPSEANESPLSVHLDKGLKVPGTAYESKDAIEQTTTLPTPKRLEISDVQTGYSAKKGFIRVATTQALQSENLSQYYTIQPAVQTTAELTENGLLIRGDFNETDTYVLTLTTAMRGVLGPKLAEAVSRDVFFGQMPAGLEFAQKKALYLSSKGSRNVGLTITNVPKVQVRIARLYENNILQYLKNFRYEEYTDGGEANGAYAYSNDQSQDLSQILVDKLVETGDLPKVRGTSALNLSIPDAGPTQTGKPLRGAYLVSVQSEEQVYVSATQLVSVSDIGLIVRKSADDILVWANSIQTTDALSGVEVSLVSSNNQTVYTLKTDSDGFARFEKVAEKAPGFTIAMLTARQGGEAELGDFNFLYLADTEVETSRFDVDGKRNSAAGIDAFIYGDRNIYRPGETIHLNTILRKAAAQNVGAIPLVIKILLPNGNEYQQLRQTTNEQGAVTADIPVDPAAVTGSYTVEVYDGNNSLLASKALSIEEFIPDRIKVDVKTDRDGYKSGQTIMLSATAQNLFGPPAADRAYEAELQLKRKEFSPKGYADYTFTIPSAQQVPGQPAPGTFEKVLRQGRTNGTGQFTETFDIPATYHDMGLLDGKLFITVFDENGRPVNRLRRFEVQTQDVLFGIRMADNYLTTNTPLAVEVVGLNAAGIPQNASAQVQVVRFDYQTVMEKQEGGSIKYNTKRREKVVYTNVLKLSGKPIQFNYVPTVSGEYEVRVRRPNQPADAAMGVLGYTAADFYAYGYGSTTASSFAVSTEGQVLMEFDKPTYETGGKVNVLFKAPFNGKMLVTVERNNVLEQKWLTVENKAAQWSFSVEEDHLPNVYVTATLIRAMDGTDLPLTVAHGFAPVIVKDADTQLPVTIEAVATSFSKTKQTIRVKTARNAQVTVAVVDEGILQLKNDKTPDPHGFFFQKRALEVQAYDGYALLYPELMFRNRSSSGGDGYDLEKRVNPLSNKRVQLVALWSGILKTGFSGEAEFMVDIPQFSGSLRVMAVAWKDNAFGSAEKNMIVSDPVVISAGVPRFLSPGDELTLPVTLNNTTRNAAGLTATVSVGGPLEVVTGTVPSPTVTDSTGAVVATPNAGATTPATQKLTVAAGRESRVTYRIRSTGGVGPGHITVTVNAMGKNYVERTDITVRPAAPLQKTTVAGVVAGGRTQTISLTGNFLPGTTRNSLTISRSPVVQQAKTLTYLLGYPYGCTEQTISKAFPQLYFADLTRSVQKANVYTVSQGDSDFNPATNVGAALRQIDSRQLYNGGITLWSGQNTEDPWATAYALHFMTEAAKAGFEVRAESQSKAIDRLTTLTSNPALERESVFDETGGRTDRSVASRTTIYGLYVLANAGKPNRAAMSYYKDAADKLLSTDERYLLATAYARLGDEKNSNVLLPKQYLLTTGERQTGGSYSSPIRNIALVLSTLVDADPDNLQVPTLARQLNTVVQQSPYLNTQEAAFAFLALGKLARQNAGSTATATLTGGGKSLGSFTGEDLLLRRLPTNQPLTLTAKGTGSLYYFGQSEGVPNSGSVPDEDRGLTIRRAFLTRDGAPMSRFKQNDLVVVKLTLTSSTGLPVDNVVITDLLPAGFEIENPRLVSQAKDGDGRDLSWAKDASTPDHFDVRDDRINYFTSAGQTPKTFYYLVRAVSRGNFILGPASADAMYNPELRSYHGAGKLRVE